jgi:hypothetical protein
VLVLVLVLVFGTGARAGASACATGHIGDVLDRPVCSVTDVPGPYLLVLVLVARFHFRFCAGAAGDWLLSIWEPP